jgi:hypothetical protein
MSLTAQLNMVPLNIQQLHSSRRFNAEHVEALRKLSSRLHKTWKRIFPPEALLPRETCEAFFEPFAQFGRALYDAYARELLDWDLTQEQYLEALNFDLKTLVCDQIYPYRERPIKTFQDAIDAGARGEVAGEWTVRMREGWRLFEHQRHADNDARVRREFIDLYGYMPELWSRLFSRIHTAISRRAIHWLSEHAERAAARDATDGTESNVSGNTGEALSHADGGLSTPKVSALNAAEPRDAASVQPVTVNSENGTKTKPQFPKRASWLKDRLLERGWSNSDPSKYHGPDRKTIEKILKGTTVRNDVIERLAKALSSKPPKVSVLDIPQD